MANDGRISPGAGLGLAPADLAGQRDAGALPLAVADHPLPPPVPGAGAPPPIAVGPATVDFSSPALRQRFERLADFAFSPSEAPSALPGEQCIEDARLNATRTFCQQLVGNHGATQYYLNPSSAFNLVSKAANLDTNRRIMVIDSLVEIVRSGRDASAAADIVDRIQGLASFYLSNGSTDAQLDNADRILPRLVQRVMERDTATANNNPLWLRFLAIANLFARRTSRGESSPANALNIHNGAGEANLPSDAEFRRLLAAYNPAAPENSPLARVVNSYFAIADLKGKFRKIAYDSPLRWRETAPHFRSELVTLAAVEAEYPDVLFTLQNIDRFTFYICHENEFQRLRNDRYILCDPGACSVMLRWIEADINATNRRPGRWEFIRDNLNTLRNHPSPEVRQQTEHVIRRIASRGNTEASSMLPIKDLISIHDEEMFGNLLETPLPRDRARIARAANYVTGAPGFVVGGFLGLVGGAIFGFFKGLVKRQNPFKTAAIEAKMGLAGGAVYGSMILGGFIGTFLVITSWSAERFLSQPATKALTLVFGLPGAIIASSLAAVIGGIVGFFIGLSSRRNPLEMAADLALSSISVGANIGLFALGGFIGYFPGKLIDWIIQRRR